MYNPNINYFVVGYHHSIIFNPNSQTLHVAGKNEDGELGVGDLKKRNQFVVLDYFQKKNEDKQDRPTRIKNVYNDRGTSNFVELDNGEIYGFGYNSTGKLGIGNFEPTVMKPVKIPFLSQRRIEMLEIYTKTIVKFSDGGTYVAGYNGHGGAGVGSFECLDNFTTLDRCWFNGGNVEKVALGRWHTIFLTNKKEVYGAGRNFCGQLGIDFIVTTQCSTPKRADFFLDKDIINISAGQDFSCFLESNGTCWSCGGNSSGQLGIGTYEKQRTPTKIKTLQNINEVKCGWISTLFITKSKEVFICGQVKHYKGILSPDLQYNDDKINVPCRVFTNIKFVEIKISFNHMILLDDNGYVYGVGSNQNGQLGFGEKQEVKQFERLNIPKLFPKIMCFNDKLMENKKYLDLRIKTVEKEFKFLGE